MISLVRMDTNSNVHLSSTSPSTKSDSRSQLPSMYELKPAGTREDYEERDDGKEKIARDEFVKVCAFLADDAAA